MGESPQMQTAREGLERVPVAAEDPGCAVLYCFIAGLW